MPLGYGDGFRRTLGNRATVLVRGLRVPVAAGVSMDTMTVNLGTTRAPLVEQGEQLVVIGASVGERILAEELARQMGTINYEVTCGITTRVPREYHRDGLRVRDT